MWITYDSGSSIVMEQVVKVELFTEDGKPDVRAFTASGEQVLRATIINFKDDAKLAKSLDELTDPLAAFNAVKRTMGETGHQDIVDLMNQAEAGMLDEQIDKVVEDLRKQWNDAKNAPLN